MDKSPFTAIADESELESIIAHTLEIQFRTLNENVTVVVCFIIG